MTGLTRQQRKALDFITSYAREKGIAPSYDEIAAAVGVKSRSRSHDLVRALADRGHIRWTPSRPRSIEVIDASAESHLRTVLDAFETGDASLAAKACLGARAFLEGRAA